MVHPEDQLSDEQAAAARAAAEAVHAADPEGSYDVYLAEQEGAEMAAKGLIKVTKDGSKLSLIKGKPNPEPYDGPTEIDL